MTDFLAYKKVEVLFTAPYSSCLNKCEYAWAVLKKLWATFVSKISVNYKKANFASDVELIAQLVGKRLTPAILTAKEELFHQCMNGRLL